MASDCPLVPSASMLVVRKAMVEGVKGENRFWRYVMYRDHRPARSCVG